MLTITVEFLHRTFRAAATDDVVLTGMTGEGEWPPSPARLVSAFVAADGTGDRCRVTDGEELTLLEAGIPRILATTGRYSTQLVGRFAVVDETDDKHTVQNYPARQAQLIRPGLRLALDHPVVHYHWPDLDVDDRRFAALRLRAARIGYLGCSDSPVRVRVERRVPEDRLSEWWEPGGEGDVQLPVPSPGFLRQLDEAFADWSAGNPRRRAWLVTKRAAYRDPSVARDTESVSPFVAPTMALWVRFDRAVSGRRVLVVADTLRRAVLERVTLLVGGDGHAVPAAIHGHGIRETPGRDHVHWLPLPFVGHPHADGRIRGACILLPPDTSTETMELVRDAVAGIEELVAPGVFGVRLSIFDGASRPWSSNPRRWTVSSRRWVSAFPVVQERFTKRGVDLAEVARWCTHAGLPEPLRFETARVPFIHGAAHLVSDQVFRSGDERRPYSHLRIEFDEPVRGPFALGRQRHFGLGLMAPDLDVGVDPHSEGPPK